MFWKIIAVVISVLVMFITPFYVKAQKNGACFKSFRLKMIAATGYLSVGVIAQLFLAEKTAFSILLLTALCFSWIGDFFLHLWQRKIYKVIGFLGFLTSHFFFISAYVTGINTFSPNEAFFSLPEIIIVVLFDAVFLLTSFLLKSNLKKSIIIPVIIYASVIMTMLCKAVRLGIAVFESPVSQTPVLALVCACLGASLFVASDFTIAFLMFNDRFKKNYKLKMFNMITYFSAELLLSYLIIFVNF